MSEENWIGLLLPCNVVVAKGEGDATEIGALRPEKMFEAIDLEFRDDNDQVEHYRDETAPNAFPETELDRFNE